MTERSGQFDSNETPDDVASLYSWANLHGAKYRDFSASRAQTRERARQRVEQAIEEERTHSHLQPVAPAAEELTEPVMAAPKAVPPQAETAAPAKEEPPREGVWAFHLPTQVQETETPPAESFNEPAPPPPPPPPAAPPPMPPEAPRVEPPIREDLATALRGLAVPPSYRQSAPPPPPPPAPMREESRMPRSPWAAQEPADSGRPAWLASEPREAAPHAGTPPAPEDTLQGSRERLATRWYALRGVLEGNVPPVQAAPAPAPARAPVMAVFSLAGGVGKTSIVATLGRALSARGERVLLIDTAAYGLLPFYFGACDQRPNLLRTFSPPSSSGDAPIQMITIEPEAPGAEGSAPEALTTEITKYSRGISRVIVDLATASGATARRILRLSPQVLVPLAPDMNSVVSVSSIDAFFERNGAANQPSLPFYVLNQFDPSMPLHLDVREVLREQLGERLLPFALRRTPAISEALAEGMTVMDYAPNSPVAEDYSSLAGWVKSLSAPATTSFRGVRWSER